MTRADVYLTKKHREVYDVINERYACKGRSATHPVGVSEEAGRLLLADLSQLGLVRRSKKGLYRIQAAWPETTP